MEFMPSIMYDSPDAFLRFFHQLQLSKFQASFKQFTNFASIACEKTTLSDPIWSVYETP
jgi:hypothetical protein